ncbi:MAG: sodium:solute symporter [Acholeplasmatales bacterium]|nr:sodium:solute symporter [Acholeplasmatales bacterium]
MSLAIKIIMIVIFFVATLYVGFYCRKKATNSNDFLLGGRNVGPWLSAFAYGTSYFSAVIFIGYAGSFGWEFGIAALWIGIGNGVIGSYMAWALLGRRTRLITQKMKSSTMPDFFGKRFNSKPLKLFASVVVFVFLIPYTAALYNGLSSLFATAFGFDEYWVWILIISIVTGIYVIIGGLMSTAVNSFIQGVIMLVGIVLVVYFVLEKNGGLMDSMSKLSTHGWQYTSLFGSDPVHLIFVVILTSLGTWGLPQMVSKFYSISNENQIRKGTIISTIFALIVAGGCYFLGGFGRLFVDMVNGAPAGGSSNIVPTMVTNLINNNVLNALLVGLVIILVLAASMSTLSSLVMVSASTLTIDLVDTVKPLAEKKKMWLLRVSILFFIVISALLAIFQIYGPKELTSDIASLMGISWGAISGAFIGPFLFGLYWKKTTKASVWASFISGVTIACLSLVFKYAGLGENGTFIGVFLSDSIYMGVVAMIASLLIVPIVSLFTKAPNQDLVEDLFSCYNDTVTVPAKEALTEPVNESVQETTNE